MGRLSALEMKQLTRMARGFGCSSYWMATRRRKIALKNLWMIYRGQKTEPEIRAIARKSFVSLLLAVIEFHRFRGLAQRPGGLAEVRKRIAHLDSVLERARAIHLETGGCIFASPHIGNFSALPSLFSAGGVQLVVPVHELANQEIHRRWWPLNSEAWPGAEIYVPRRNSFHTLRRALNQGRSVGILPDQRTLRGVALDFLGYPALTTPVPALLSLACNRPIVVGACCRRKGLEAYEIVLSEPLWPEPSRDKRSEIVRLTRELNQRMERLIRENPEQYFWMHDRWKF